jgi:hypothetical protein
MAAKAKCETCRGDSKMPADKKDEADEFNCGLEMDLDFFFGCRTQTDKYIRNMYAHRLGWENSLNVGLLVLALTGCFSFAQQKYH